MAIDEDALGGASGDAHIHGVTVDEVGDELAEALSRARRGAGAVAGSAAGLWSLNLLAQGRRTRKQLLEAAKAAEEARTQVVKRCARRGVRGSAAARSRA